jgi:hypothetical protein
MKRNFIPWLSALLILLTLGGVHSVYWLTRFLWMATAEPQHKSLWSGQISGWLTVSLVIGVSWITLFLTIVHHGRQRQ